MNKIQKKHKVNKQPVLVKSVEILDDIFEFFEDLTEPVAPLILLALIL